MYSDKALQRQKVLSGIFRKQLYFDCVHSTLGGIRNQNLGESFLLLLKKKRKNCHSDAG